MACIGRPDRRSTRAPSETIKNTWAHLDGFGPFIGTEVSKVVAVTMRLQLFYHRPLVRLGPRLGNSCKKLNRSFACLHSRNIPKYATASLADELVGHAQGIYRDLWLREDALNTTRRKKYVVAGPLLTVFVYIPIYPLLFMLHLQFGIESWLCLPNKVRQKRHVFL